MTDLEMTKLCAEAMGWANFGSTRDGTPIVWNKENASTVTAYNPLHDDAQAMALVRKFHIELEWDVEWFAGKASWSEKHIDLNRAIVECVAKMQKAKHGTDRS